MDQQPRRRMGAEERRASILQAAARVFERTGDLGSTTTKMIAEEAGVNEAILYRHFASKEEIFYDAVVEPLRVPIQEFVAHAGTSVMERSRAERVAFFGDILHGMVVKLAAELPALGLVLFGGPDVARGFYASAWEPALRRLAEDWRAIFESVGHRDYNDPMLSAEIVVGTCLSLALAKRHGGPQGAEELAREKARCGEIARMMYDGVFKFAD
ncbi:TetR/AcrR family transcriptional regulator [Nocardioides carbamazepini]|jgi:AcrR family transcriptional regulator|uniref:TetR/AcrR family transcriptional regulator n=1 Tax=Nocardioides carbamazepini TaxID=2854259 RepID=UPI00214A85BC|nr:TetR/AcrR family transcriptional regulator [Nocardioides carbamazepini]MCR1785072.1 TetR/AcrR family transcriptional regulator [Nocardioides carbamazepini]